MSLHEEKIKLVDHMTQLIQFDRSGKLIDSTNEILKIEKGVDLFEEISFLSSIREPLETLKVRDTLTFNCIQSDYFGVGRFFDFTFFVKQEAGDDSILFLVEEFTPQYQKVLELQQDRNVDAIAKENEEIEALKKIPEAENIFIKVDSLLLNFKPQDIQYIEAFGDYIKIHTADQFYVSYTKLRSMEDILPQKDFVRIHRSYIVRIDQIISLNQQKLQIKDTILPISLSYKEDLLSRIKKLN